MENVIQEEQGDSIILVPMLCRTQAHTIFRHAQSLSEDSDELAKEARAAEE